MSVVYASSVVVFCCGRGVVKDTAGGRHFRMELISKLRLKSQNREPWGVEVFLSVVYVASSVVVFCSGGGAVKDSAGGRVIRPRSNLFS